MPSNCYLMALKLHRYFVDGKVLALAGKAFVVEIAVEASADPLATGHATGVGGRVYLLKKFGWNVGFEKLFGRSHGLRLGLVARWLNRDSRSCRTAQRSS